MYYILLWKRANFFKFHEVHVSDVRVLHFFTPLLSYLIHFLYEEYLLGICI